MILAAVRHQVRRPGLARLLDFEEGRLPFDPGTRFVRSEFANALGKLLARLDLPHQLDLPTATADVAAIMRGMLDAAGERGDVEETVLATRVRRAVLGYLATPLDGSCGSG